MTTLDISELTVAYGRFRAVDGVSLQVAAGQCYALVGESGCGKTTLARTVTGLLEPASGEVRVEGTRIDRVRGRDVRALRRRIQIVFQNPYAALNPRMSVARLVGEPLRLARPELSGAARTEAALELLGSVGLGERFLERRPHELSGGQCQRVAIARALAMDPALLVLDEPTSALDVSVQAQVLNLLADLRARRGLAYLLISHDLGVVRHLADRIGVMRAGRLVEEGGTRQVLTEPAAAYTRTLIAAIPGRGRAALLAGAEPAPPDPDPDPAPDPAPAAARAPATGPAGGPAVSPAQIEPNTGSST